MTTRSQSKRLIQNAALLLASLAIAVCLIEVGFRLGARDLNASPLWRYHSTYGWTIDPAVESIDHVNADGFRHRAAVGKKPPGTRRLLILGDSFTQATGIPYASTFPGIIETWLNEAPADEMWEVLNLGVGDWGSAQQVIALEAYGLAFEPDVVVLQVFPFNDFCNNSPQLAETCSMQDFHRPYLVAGGDGALRVTHLSEWRAALRSRLTSFGILENRLVLANQVRLSQASSNHRDLAKQRNAFFEENAAKLGLPYSGAMASLVPEAVQPPRLRQAWAASEGIVERLTTTLAEEGIPLLAVVVPYKLSLSRSWHRFEQNPKTPYVADHGTRRFEEMFVARGVATLSMRGKILDSGMQPADFFRTTDSHFDAYGHFRFATWILETLSARGLTDVDPPTPSFGGGDLIAHTPPLEVRVEGLHTVQRRSREAPLFRIGFGHSSRLVFWSVDERQMAMEFRLKSLIPEQTISVVINGRESLSSPNDDHQNGPGTERTLSFVSLPGRNEIRFDYRDWNDQPGRSLIAGQPRAVRFEKLSFRKPSE